MSQRRKKPSSFTIAGTLPCGAPLTRKTAASMCNSLINWLFPITKLLVSLALVHQQQRWWNQRSSLCECFHQCSIPGRLLSDDLAGMMNHALGKWEYGGCVNVTGVEQPGGAHAQVQTGRPAATAAAHLPKHMANALRGRVAARLLHVLCQ